MAAKILVVDDDPNVQRLLQYTLKQEGYDVISAVDGAEGFRLWGTDLPIADVAAETGFADQSHLTRVLAAHSAWTPLRLRSLAPCRKNVSEPLIPPRRFNEVTGGYCNEAWTPIDQISLNRFCPWKFGEGC